MAYTLAAIGVLSSRMVLRWQAPTASNKVLGKVRAQLTPTLRMELRLAFLPSRIPVSFRLSFDDNISNRLP